MRTRSTIRILLVGFAILVSAPSGVQASVVQPAKKLANGPRVYLGLDYLFAQDVALNGGGADTKINTLGFKVGVYHRFGTFDLGVLAGHHGMGTFRSSGGQRFFTSGQTYANFDIRWRFRNHKWGSMVLDLGFGFAGFSQTNEAVAESEEAIFFDRIMPRFGTGFNVQFGVGVLIGLTDQIANYLRIGMSSAFTIDDENKPDSGRMQVLNLMVSYGIELLP